jgi:hypothetical protein
MVRICCTIESPRLHVTVSKPTKGSSCHSPDAALILPKSVMAVSSSSPDTIGIPNLAGVIISTYAEESRPILTLLVIYVALGAMCLPLLLAVFYFSTPRIRRTPLFMIIVFDIFLGVGMSCWMATCTVCHRFFRLKTTSAYFLTESPVQILTQATRGFSAHLLPGHSFHYVYRPLGDRPGSSSAPVRRLSPGDYPVAHELLDIWHCSLYQGGSSRVWYCYSCAMGANCRAKSIGLGLLIR